MIAVCASATEVRVPLTLSARVGLKSRLAQFFANGKWLRFSTGPWQRKLWHLPELDLSGPPA
jgi:hypothetical protein